MFDDEQALDEAYRVLGEWRNQLDALLLLRDAALVDSEGIRKALEMQRANMMGFCDSHK